MSMFITDARNGLFVKEGSALQKLDCPAEYPCCPCARGDALYCACRARRDVFRLSKSEGDTIDCFASLPQVCAMACSTCGQYLYQLSEEADCVCAFGTENGDLLFGCKQGVFPRDMRLHRSGRWLLIAGGASGEATVVSAPELRVAEHYEGFGAVCSADFCREGVVLLCAVENGDIQTVLATVNGRTHTLRELARFEGQSGIVRACPDGRTALVGALDGLFCVSLEDGGVLWQAPQIKLCRSICFSPRQALLSDCLGGEVAEALPPSTIRLACVGEEAQAVYC